MTASRHLRPTTLIVILAGCVFGGSAIRAQNEPAPPPVFPAGPPASGSVIVENEYRFTVRQYTPAVDVVVVPRAKATDDNPEAAAIAGISAMVSQDFDWFRSTWDRASVAILEARDKEMKQDATFWTRAWQRAFTGKKIQLVSRIDTGGYVIIVYRVLGSAARGNTSAENADIELSTVLKRDGDRWLATQELAQDPVLVNRKNPDARPRRVVR
jgi:hypothetical protein